MYIEFTFHNLEPHIYLHCSIQYVYLGNGTSTPDASASHIDAV